MIGADVKIGKGTTILPGTILRGKTEIGENCVIGPNSYITVSYTHLDVYKRQEQDLEVRWQTEQLLDEKDICAAENYLFEKAEQFSGNPDVYKRQVCTQSGSNIP